MAARDHVWEWSAAVLHPSGVLQLVGVAYAEDQYADAKDRAMDHVHAWQRDLELIGAHDGCRVVFVRRPIARWEVVDA